MPIQPHRRVFARRNVSCPEVTERGCLISFNYLRAVLLGAPSHAGLALLGFAVSGVAFTCIGAVLVFTTGSPLATGRYKARRGDPA